MHALLNRHAQGGAAAAAAASMPRSARHGSAAAQLARGSCSLGWAALHGFNCKAQTPGQDAAA